MNIDAFMDKVNKWLKPFIKPTLVILGIYCFAMIAIWRSNFSFMDDMGRSVQGYAWISDFFRFSSSILGYLLNVSIGLSDISPYSQIFAMFLLSISSIIVTYILCNRKIRYVPLILSTFIGLTPFMMACWVFKFDAPCMALSILASLVPFLFWPNVSYRMSKFNLTLFIVVSILSLMVMWTSYQATSGLYLVMLIGLIFKDFLDKHSLKDLFKKATFYAVLYIVSVIVFKLLMVGVTEIGERLFGRKPTGGYRPMEMYSLVDLPAGIVKNIKQFLETISSSMNVEWKILLVLTVISFLTTLFIYSKRKSWQRLLDPLAGVLMILISVPLSYGSYLVLQDAPVSARSIMGIGLVLATIAVITANRSDGLLHKLLIVPSLVLLYSFVVFAFAFGNGLADQQRYANFRNDNLISDMARTYSIQKNATSKPIQIEGNIGRSPVLEHVGKQYPVVGAIFSDPDNMFGMGNGPWGTAKLRMYYGWDLSFSAPDSKLLNCKNIPVKLQSYFHTIRIDEAGNTCVVIN